MTLYGLIANSLAQALGIPAAAVPSSEVVKRMNPFANPTTGAGPTVNNPWIRHVDSDAQGYAVVTLSKTELVCEFKKLHRLGVNFLTGNPVASVKKVRVPAGQSDVQIV